MLPFYYEKKKQTKKLEHGKWYQFILDGMQ